jgi:hypothetical protein
VDQWNAPEGFSVNVASANATQVGIFVGSPLFLWANIIALLVRNELIPMTTSLVKHVCEGNNFPVACIHV